MSPTSNLIAIEPKSFPAYVTAVESSGGQVVPLSAEVGALIWTDYSNPTGLATLLENNPQITWVQLPFAGVDAFSEILKLPFRFTSAKGAYREPVAEHALALCLALGRILPIRIKAQSWGKSVATSFYDCNALIVGGGGIAEELIRLLLPFRAKITVVRNRPENYLEGSQRTVGPNQLEEYLPEADLVILAAASTPSTQGLFDFDMLSKMKSEAFLVNVARGNLVVTDDLLKALDQGIIAGAALDVTDPEPLPDFHPAFGRSDLIITPHSADTKEIVTRLFAVRVRENVTAYLGKGDWVGEVDSVLGY